MRAQDLKTGDKFFELSGRDGHVDDIEFIESGRAESAQPYVKVTDRKGNKVLLRANSFVETLCPICDGVGHLPHPSGALVRCARCGFDY